MSVKNYKDFLHKTEQCPLCDEVSAKFHSLPRTNRYSEEIAKHLGVAEDCLLKSLENLICDTCGLIYKSQWFDSSVLESLFNDLIPLHPRGWDTVSGRFSATTFYHELDLYAQALKNKDIENINRYRRALTSLIDSIRSGDLLFDRELALRNIEVGRLDYFREFTPTIQSSFGKPELFKRFSGHASQALWEHAHTIIQSIRSYAEIGCPLWGMLRIAADTGMRTVYIKRREVNFWSDKCRNENMTCLQKCTSIIPSVEVLGWDGLRSNKVDLVGVYQYIDHLERPLEFFGQLFERARAVVVVIDDAYNSPSYIQHFTGWPPLAIKFVADFFGKQVDDSFLASQIAGHNTFILH